MIDNNLQSSARERDQLVAWLRTLSPDQVAEATIAQLRNGVSEDDLWATAALTACRYLNNQAQNLLGFVTHAMIGGEDARHLAVGQPTPVRWTLLAQVLAQVVRDMHDPCFAPFELLPFWPHHEKTVAENIALLRGDCRFGEFMRADHRFVGLEQRLPRAELIDLMLDIGLEGVATDEHCTITPVLCLGLTDLLGWERGFDLLRWSLRYNASFARHFGPYDRAIALVDQYNLQNGAAETAMQPDQIEALRATLLAAEAVDRPEVIARALADSISPATAVAAVSLAACQMYLMVDPVPHEDFDAVSREVAPIHIGTGVRALRAGLRRMSPRTQVLAAIQGGSLLERGPSVLNETFVFVPFVPKPAYPYPEDSARLAGKSPDTLLATLDEALHRHDCALTCAAVRAYADSGAAAEPLIAALIAVACTDEGTLLHNFKHLQAMVCEFRESQSPQRWNYLIAAAKFASWYAGKNTGVYRQTQLALDPKAY